MLNKEKIRVVAIVGPTASGKTKLAINVAKRLSGEIISADSMQIYKKMDIATAKPTKAEMCGVPHHMMDFLPTDKDFSVAEYVKLTKKIIIDINARKKTVILCGGTGLYIQSLLENIKFAECNPNLKLRKELLEKATKDGSDKLWEELKRIDPESAERIHPNNVKRVIRAIEIYEEFKITMTKQIEKSKEESSAYDVVYIGLTYKNRQHLYDKIDKRVESMISRGLLKETETIMKSNCSKTALGAIGYKELIPFLNKEYTFDEAIAKIKIGTRRYAKRQLTWFKRNKNINWIYLDDCKSFEEVLNNALDVINENHR